MARSRAAARTTRRRSTTPVREPERTSGHRPRASRARVLVVDDGDDNRDIYTTYFVDAGFEATEAMDGVQALACVARSTPDIIVMDLAMPNMDGWEATRILKSDPRTRGILILALTGHATSRAIEAALDAGADEVCTKPCPPKELLERVKALLARRW